MAASGGQAYWLADITATTSAEQFHDVTAATRPYDNAPVDITLFVSCYNEAAHIVETLDTICSAAREVGVSFEVRGIDDCS